MDLTPRTGAATLPDGAPRPDQPNEGARPSRSTRQRWRNVVAVALVLGALGFVVFRGLGNAALFFYNVDEAVAKQQSLGTDRFRLQGTVEDGALRHEGTTSIFTVTYNGVEAPVRHTGEIPKMFAAGIPVVLEGRWQGGVFESSRMLVKHNEVYVANNPDRVQDYNETPGPSPTEP